MRMLCPLVDMLNHAGDEAQAPGSSGGLSGPRIAMDNVRYSYNFVFLTLWYYCALNDKVHTCACLLRGPAHACLRILQVCKWGGGHMPDEAVPRPESLPDSLHSNFHALLYDDALGGQCMKR